MTVREIAEEAAILIGIMDLYSYLTDEGIPDNASQAEKDTDILVRCVNIVLGEIANEYVPLKKTAEIESDDGLIRYEDFGDVVLDILAAEDEHGNNLKYSLYPDYFKVRPGKVKVEYTYLPERKKLDDEVDYKSGRVTGRIIAYGVAGEYCLINGDYEEAYMWDKRYKDGLMYATGLSGRKLYIKAGRWL